MEGAAEFNACNRRRRVIECWDFETKIACLRSNFAAEAHFGKLLKTPRPAQGERRGAFVADRSKLERTSKSSAAVQQRGIFYSRPRREMRTIFLRLRRKLRSYQQTSLSCHPIAAGHPIRITRTNPSG